MKQYPASHQLSQVLIGITSIVTSPYRHGISFHPIMYISVIKIFNLLFLLLYHVYKMKELISCMFHKESKESYITSIVTSPDRHGISFHPIVYIIVIKTFKSLSILLCQI